MVGIVEVEIEIAKEDEFTGAEAVVVKKRVKFFVKHGGCEFVFSTGRGSVDAGKDDALAGFIEQNFSAFKRVRRKGQMLGERQVRVKYIFVQNGDSTAPAGAGKGSEFVSWRSQLFADGLVTKWLEPCFSEKGKIKIIIKHKIRNSVSF